MSGFFSLKHFVQPANVPPDPAKSQNAIRPPLHCSQISGFAGYRAMARDDLGLIIDHGQIGFCIISTSSLKSNWTCVMYQM